MVPPQRRTTAMSATAIPRPFADQDAFSRRVWTRLVNDPAFSGALEKVETDRGGNLIMSPPPPVRQNLIVRTLDTPPHRQAQAFRAGPPR
jgi:hypothetical protein